MKKEWKIQEILEEGNCLQFLERQKVRIHAPDLRTTASMIMKRHAQWMVRTVFGAYLNEARPIRLDIATTSLDDTLIMKIENSEEVELNNLMKTLFADHLTPLLRTLNKVTRLSERILWENIAVRVNSFFRKAMESDSLTCQEQARLMELYDLLVDATADSFGTSRHPLNTFLNSKSQLASLQTRQTCCHFYRLEKEKEMDYCLVCPLKRTVQPSH